MKSNRFEDPSQPLTSAEEAIAETQAVYTSLAALYMSFDQVIFPRQDTPAMQEDIILYTEPCIFMKVVIFWISVGILALHILVLMLYLFSPHKKFLPRLPITIASTIADVAASHALKSAGTSFEDRRRYGYGGFVGADGVDRVGIDEAEKITPLRPQ